jgi:nucleotide-binding universal stress UspA family protein
MPSLEHDRRNVLAGYDGSPSAANAIEVGARLLPGFSVQVVHVWSLPFGDPELRRRLAGRAASLDELRILLEQEVAAEAERVAAEGVALANACGWHASPRTHRSYGGEGFELAQLAEETRPAAVVVGARGLGGVRAVLGSVSDMVVHYSPVPVLVVPHPLLTVEREAAADGPVVIGFDGSEGSQAAIAAAVSLFPGRELVTATVGDGDIGDPADAEPPAVEATHDHVVLEMSSRIASGERRTAETLAALAAQRGAAALVVGSRGRSPVREMLLGSVAKATLHHAQRPVLVVPAGSRFGSGENG